MDFLLTITITWIVTELIGYIFHRLTHWSRMGALYDSHMTHHLKIYPPSNFFSDSYLKAGKDSFTIRFIPLFLGVVILEFWFLPLHLSVVALLTTSLCAFLNSYIHDSYHIRNHFLSKFRYYRRLRALHYLHHVQMSKNYGIYWLGFDKMAGTYKKGYSSPSSHSSSQDINSK